MFSEDKSLQNPSALQSHLLVQDQVCHPGNQVLCQHTVQASTVGRSKLLNKPLQLGPKHTHTHRHIKTTSLDLWQFNVCSSKWAVPAVVGEHGGQLLHGLVKHSAGWRWRAPARGGCSLRDGQGDGPRFRWLQHRQEKVHSLIFCF